MNTTIITIIMILILPYITMTVHEYGHQKVYQSLGVKSHTGFDFKKLRPYTSPYDSKDILYIDADGMIRVLKAGAYSNFKFATVVILAGVTEIILFHSYAELSFDVFMITSVVAVINLLYGLMSVLSPRVQDDFCKIRAFKKIYAHYMQTMTSEDHLRYEATKLFGDLQKIARQGYVIKALSTDSSHELRFYKDGDLQSILIDEDGIITVYMRAIESDIPVLDAIG